MPAASNGEPLCERGFETSPEPFGDSLTLPILHRDEDLHAMEFQVAESVPDDEAGGAGRVTAAGVGLADPVAQMNTPIGDVGELKSAGPHHGSFGIADHERMATFSPIFVHPLLGAVR